MRRDLSLHVLCDVLLYAAAAIANALASAVSTMTDSEGNTEDETSSASSLSPMEGIITSQPSDEDSDAYMSDSQNDVAENVEPEDTAASRARRPVGDGSSEDEDEPPVKNPSTDICVGTNLSTT